METENNPNKGYNENNQCHVPDFLRKGQKGKGKLGKCTAVF